jgi:RNA polymerase sigma-70 factor (ECF subfamily)
MGSTNQPEDYWLLEQYRSGYNEALAVLVKRWHGKLCKQAYWYTKDLHISKDIAQDSWTVVIEKTDSLKDSKKFGSWILSIVTNKSIDWIRKQNRIKGELEFHRTNFKETENDASINNSEVTNDVLKEIQNLPESQQIVLKLFYLESCSLKQISKLLKISQGTVKSRLFYARENLKSIIKHRNYEQEY